jgi:hypothetical protein
MYETTVESRLQSMDWYVGLLELRWLRGKELWTITPKQ